MSKEHIFNELEKFHKGKLDEVRDKRAGAPKPDQAQELVAGGTINIRVDPSNQQLIVSWK